MGTGQFGVVRIALHRPSGEVYALKVGPAQRMGLALACRMLCYYKGIPDHLVQLHHNYQSYLKPPFLCIGHKQFSVKPHASCAQHRQNGALEHDLEMTTIRVQTCAPRVLDLGSAALAGFAKGGAGGDRAG